MTTTPHRIARSHLARVRTGVAVGALILSGAVLTAPAAAAPPTDHGRSVLSSILPSARSGLRWLRDPHGTRNERSRSGPHPLTWGSTTGPTPTIPTASGVAYDSTTQTLYVTSELDNTVAVVDARSCNARRTHCRAPVATMQSLATGSAIQLDSDHRTLYVAQDSGNVVAALDLRHCSARDTSGCSGAPNTVPVGPGSVGLSLNRGTHTLYVGSETSPMAVLDTATCNGHTNAGCAAPIATIGGPGLRLFPAVDPVTETLYAPVAPDSGDPGVEVWDVSACRAGATSGCSAPPVSFVPIGTFVLFVLLDRTSGTLFTGNLDDGSLSLVDARTCNAANVSSCAAQHPKASLQLPTDAATIDPRTRTLYVMGQVFDQVAAIDLRTCTVDTPGGCPTRPRTWQTIAHPYGLELDPATGTFWLPSPVENTFQVFDARRCSAERTDGCRHPAPTAAGQITELDPAHHTAYQLFDGQPALGLLDTARCNSTTRSACADPVRVPFGQQPGPAIIDAATHTLYVADQQTQDLMVVDTDHCNVRRHDDCAPFAAIPLTGSGNPFLNPRTHTIYVAVSDQSIAVIDGARCNALDRSGCGQDPLRVPVDGSPSGMWVDPTTNTVYVGNIEADDVFLLDGAACDARTTMCRVIAQTTVGSHPVGVDGNGATHTVYVANFAFTDEPGSLSLIDTRHCQAADTSGCGHTWPRAATGHSPITVVDDTATNTVFTANLQGTVSIIPAGRCTAQRQDGCPPRPPRIAVGTAAVDAHIDTGVHTLYVLNSGAGEGTSIIDTRHPCRSAVCFR